MKIITIHDVETIAFKLARAHLTGNEPIPDFTTRFPNKLESCLAVPFQSFTDYEPYPTLIKKASMLFYLMNKNHPFQNGNKRIALTALLTFLYLNDKWLDATPYDLYEFSMHVAVSRASMKRWILEACEGYITRNLTKL